MGQPNQPARTFQQPGFQQELWENKTHLLPSPPIQVVVTPRPPSLSYHGPIPLNFQGANAGSILLPLPPGRPPLFPPNPAPIPTSQHPSHHNQPAGSAFSGLIGSLMAKGFLSLPPQISGEGPLGMEFDPDILKVGHGPAVRALYDDIPRQCSTCGLRFTCQEDHSSHMDWHVRKNRMSKIKQKLCRKWFVDTSMWLTAAESARNEVVSGFIPTETAADEKFEQVPVPADEDQSTCGFCGEPFDDFYCDETDEWMYKGAVYMNRPNGIAEGSDKSTWGPIVHAKCMDTRDGSHEGNIGHEETSSNVKAYKNKSSKRHNEDESDHHPLGSTTSQNSTHRPSSSAGSEHKSFKFGSDPPFSKRSILPIPSLPSTPFSKTSEFTSDGEPDHPMGGYGGGIVVGGKENSMDWRGQSDLSDSLSLLIREPPPAAYTHSNVNVIDIRGPRALIDAYGNDRGGNEVDDKLPHIAARSSAARGWRNAEEEEYNWEEMSPTPADSSRNIWNAVQPSQNLTARNGLKLLRNSDLKQNNWPSTREQTHGTVGIEFDLDILKVLHEPVVSALYDDIPRQCSTCGLRFRCQEDHSSHMDWHVTKNRMPKNKQKLCRKWFVDTSMWLIGAESMRTDVVSGFLPTETVAEEKYEQVSVPADADQSTCGFCGEAFDDFYCDETDKWMYSGAVYMNRLNGIVGSLDKSTLGPIVHAKCMDTRDGSHEGNIEHEETYLNVKAYKNKSSTRYNEDESDHHPLDSITYQNGTHRPSSRAGFEHKSFKFGSDPLFFPQSTDFSRRSISPIPSLPSTPSSPKISEFTSDGEPDHPMGGYGGGIVVGRGENCMDWSRKPSGVSDSVSYTHNNVSDIDLRGPRALIDAYGNDRGRDEVDDKLPHISVKSSVVNGMKARDLAARGWQNAEEEEYNWEEMSPTPADSSTNNRNSAQPSHNLTARNGIKLLRNSDLKQNNWPSTREQAHSNGEGFPKTLSELQGGRNQLLDYHQPQDPSWDPQKNLDRFPEHMPNIEGRGSHNVFSAGGMPSRLNSYTDSEVQHHRNQPTSSSKTIPDTQPTVGISTINVNRPDLLPTPPVFMNTIIQNDAYRPVMFPEPQLSNSERATQGDLHLLSALQPTLATMVQPNQPARPFQQPGFHQELWENKTHLLSPPPIQVFVTPRPPLMSHHGPMPAPFLPHLNRPFHFQPANACSILPPLLPGRPPLFQPHVPLPLSQHPSHHNQPAGSAFSGLIGSLMAKGLLSLPPQISGEGPAGMEFDVDVLKVRHEPTVRALYDDIPRQCSTCGLRFMCQEDP